MKKLETHLLKQGYCHIAGIDEAGRGPVAGPVIAAAVVLPREEKLSGIKDSKKLSQTKRELLNEQIYNLGKVGIGVSSATEIDEINILQATLKAMYRAVLKLQEQIKVDFCIVDGNRTIPRLGIAQKAVIKADDTCYIAAAASIAAKVHRDNLMIEYDQKYPQYGFARHKGYLTKMHLAALQKYGPSPIHRFTFAPMQRSGIS